MSKIFKSSYTMTGLQYPFDFPDEILLTEACRDIVI